MGPNQDQWASGTVWTFLCLTSKLAAITRFSRLQIFEEFYNLTKVWKFFFICSHIKGNSIENRWYNKATKIYFWSLSYIATCHGLHETECTLKWRLSMDNKKKKTKTYNNINNNNYFWIYNPLHNSNVRIVE